MVILLRSLMLSSILGLFPFHSGVHRCTSGNPAGYNAESWGNLGFLQKATKGTKIEGQMVPPREGNEGKEEGLRQLRPKFKLRFLRYLL